MFSKLKTLTVTRRRVGNDLGVRRRRAPTSTFASAPPPPRHEAVPPARAGYVWAPGYWDWRGHRHVWVNGHWERARHGYVTTSRGGSRNGDRWRLHRGAWSRGDRDHDGVPNAVDRHPDNPRRP